MKIDGKRERSRRLPRKRYLHAHFGSVLKLPAMCIRLQLIRLQHTIVEPPFKLAYWIVESPDAGEIGPREAEGELVDRG
jgi:hypothetical protein